MTQKHFIALADAIRAHNEHYRNTPFKNAHLITLTNFCKAQNPKFRRALWLSYLEGTSGPLGGKVKEGKQ